MQLNGSVDMNQPPKEDKEKGRQGDKGTENSNLLVPLSPLLLVLLSPLLLVSTPHSIV
jgi:hypothetical protein